MKKKHDEDNDDYNDISLNWQPREQNGETYTQANQGLKA